MQSILPHRRKHFAGVVFVGNPQPIAATAAIAMTAVADLSQGDEKIAATSVASITSRRAFLGLQGEILVDAEALLAFPVTAGFSADLALAASPSLKFESLAAIGVAVNLPALPVAPNPDTAALAFLGAATLTMDNALAAAPVVAFSAQLGPNRYPIEAAAVLAFPGLVDRNYIALSAAPKIAFVRPAGSGNLIMDLALDAAPLLAFPPSVTIEPNYVEAAADFAVALAFAPSATLAKGAAASFPAIVGLTATAKTAPYLVNSPSPATPYAWQVNELGPFLSRVFQVGGHPFRVATGSGNAGPVATECYIEAGYALDGFGDPVAEGSAAWVQIGGPYTVQARNPVNFTDSRVDTGGGTYSIAAFTSGPDAMVAIYGAPRWNQESTEEDRSVSLMRIRLKFRPNQTDYFGDWRYSPSLIARWFIDRSP